MPRQVVARDVAEYFEEEDLSVEYEYKARAKIAVRKKCVENQ